MVLEQFIHQVPTRISEWVQFQHPDLLTEAVQLVEDHMSMYADSGTQHALLPTYKSPPTLAFRAMNCAWVLGWYIAVGQAYRYGPAAVDGGNKRSGAFPWVTGIRALSVAQEVIIGVIAAFGLF